uniref:Peptidase_M13 domain-containing protein n=1 Tax=Strongyloides stercoralis TaxID=6248 RepID=A0A0K0E5Z9_STRER
MNLSFKIFYFFIALFLFQNDKVYGKKKPIKNTIKNTIKETVHCTDLFNDVFGYYADVTIRPCDDFLKFACGSFREKEDFKQEERDFGRFVAELQAGRHYEESKLLKHLQRFLLICERASDYEKLGKCLFELYKFGTYAYSSFYINHIKKNKNLEKEFKFIEKMFDNLKNSFKDLIKNKRFLDKKTKDNYIKKIKKMKLYKKFHSTLNDIKSMEKCYNLLDLDKIEDYSTLMTNMQNYSSIVSAKIKKDKKSKKDKQFEESCIKSIVDQKIEDVSFSLLIQDTAFYHSKKNSVIVNPSLLKYPYYDSRLPLSLIYGSLGFAIGREMVHAIDCANLNIDDKGKKNSKFTSPSRLGYILNKCEIFLEQFETERNDTVDVTIENSIYLNDDVADNAGIKIAYMAYKKYLEKNSDNINVIWVTPFTHERFFFINFAKFICTSKKYSEKFDVKEEKKLDVFRIQNTLGNFNVFAETFKCWKGSNMINDIKYELW